MRITFTVACLLIAFTAFSQTFLMNGAPITSCGGTFYDSGGPTGNYGNNQNLTTTICSNGSGGTHVRLTFSGLQLAPNDVLCFYDGTSTAAPLLACSDDYPAGQPFIVQATAVNPTGCITVSFVSDGSDNQPGWSAVISCVASCQTVLGQLVSTNPAIVPADTGWIDVCPGERIFLSGKGAYPQNGFAYQQSDLTTRFEWNFGDGTIAYGPNTSHRFTESGGYYIQMYLTDTLNCRSTNLINQRVRVAPRPTFNLATFNNTICAGDTIQLSAAVDSTDGKTLVVLPYTSAFAVEGSRSDSLSLPDGTGIPYETSIFFTEFSPGQVLTNPDDLENICANMEHSWVRDLEITLTCPSGATIILHNFGGQTGSQVFLGEPNDFDNALNPVPGLGYDYCWTNNATNGTWLQYANTVLGGMGTLPSGDYSPFDPFSDLIGCPLNGEWTITATDLWPIDNGFIFNWSIKFKDELYPNIETFTPQFTSWSWNTHPSIFYTSTDSIAAAPQNAGTAAYTFTVNDDFGCTWDTLVTVSVLPFTNPNCYKCQEDFRNLRDTVVCAGAPVVFDATSNDPAVREVRFEAFPDYKIGNSNHPHNNPYGAPISVNSLGYNILTNPITQVTSVCMDIETDYDADLNVYLRAPDGKQLELTTGNGGSGDNYKITCFTPSSTNAIIGKTAPFNGTYKPEGNWSSLNNAMVNGDWKLMVSDGFGTSQFGRIKWWSIGFNYTNTVSYTWTNAASLSCNNCATPIATPSVPTTYIVSTTDNFGCKHRDTVNVAITTLFPAPTGLQVISVGTSSMTWAWDPMAGITNFEISVNGGPWQPASGPLSHTVTGLVSGDVVQVEVRAIGGSASCPPSISLGTQQFFVCTLNATLTSIQPAVCAGTATGSAFVAVAGVTPPVEFFADGKNPPYSLGDFDKFFLAGDHFVIVRDATGCRDTVNFLIAEPPPIVLATSTTPVVCNGGNTGTATASATGGVGTVNFMWQGCAGGTPSNNAVAPNLYAGCYAVTATDTNGCTATDSITVDEPTALQLVTAQDSVQCFGELNGRASITVSGAMPPYSYLWDNAGETTAAITGLAAGQHTVTVRDAVGCQAITSVQVLQPALLTVDSTNVKNLSCFGGNNGTAQAFPIGGVKPYTYQWSDAQVSAKAQALSAGTYTVTITDANNCTTTATLTLTSPPQLLLSITGTMPEKCTDQCDGQTTVQASGGSTPYDYIWGTTTVPDGTTNPTNLCAGTYAVTVHDFRGCTVTDKVTIAPAVPIDVHYTDISPTCVGLQNGSFVSVAAGGAGGYQFTWSTGAITPNLPNIACGNYGVTLTDANGCQKIDTLVLTCPNGLQVQSVTPQPVQCFGQSNGAVAVVVQGGTGTISYVWSDAAAQNTATASNLPIGTYTVTIMDANGCNTTASAIIIQPNPFTVSTVQTDATCLGIADGTITATAFGGTMPYDFVWNTAATGAALTALTAGTYTVTVKDAKNCTTLATGSINEPLSEVAVLVSQVEEACFGESNGSVAAVASGGNGEPFTYVWSNGSTSETASGIAGGTTVTVTATDNKGCTSVQNFESGQFDSIRINIVVVQPTCYGASDGVLAINFVSGGLGNGDTTQYNYQWNVQNSPTTPYLINLTGDKTYIVTVTDFKGCSNSFSNTLPQPQAIVLQTDITNVSCFGRTDGAVKVTGALNATQPVTYTWSNNSTGNQITALAAGIYLVDATDQQGCKTQQAVTVTEPPVLAVRFDVKQLLCSSDSNATIAANVLGGTPNYTLTWSNNAGSTNLSQLGPGNYILQIEDENGCKLTDSVLIIRPDDLSIAIETIDPKCFSAANGRLNLNVTGGALPYRYSLNGGDFGGSSTFIGLSAGNYALRVRDFNNCITNVTAVLDQPPAVLVQLGADTTIILGESVTLTPDVNNAFGQVIYTWKGFTVDSIRCIDVPDCATISVQPLLTNTYRVIVSDANGCTADDIQTVFVEKPRGVYVPTAFSPNNDQINDFLIVHGKGRQISNVISFKLYDRWGELLYQDQNFKVNDATRGWDGTFRGATCDPGVYIWQAEVEYLDGFRESAKGNVTLIR